MPRDVELFHPPVSLDETTTYDFSHHLAYERVACRLAGELQAGPAAQRTAARKWRTWWERQESGRIVVKALTAQDGA